MNAIDIKNEPLSEEYEEYDDFLDEVSGDVQIGILSYSASQVLKEVDPIAYRCGFSDWLDSMPRPWKCEECDETYETEEKAEECCQTMCDQCGKYFPDGTGIEIDTPKTVRPFEFCSIECQQKFEYDYTTITRR
jgi:hypothetical protein